MTAQQAAELMWEHRGHHEEADPCEIMCRACDRYIGSAYSHIIDHQVDMLADAGLLADTRCRKCAGTGGTDLGNASCAVCEGTGHRRAER